MKIFHIFLLIALCLLIVCSKSSFCGTNCKICGTQITSANNAYEVISLADSECDKFNYAKSIRLYKKALRLNPSKSDEIYLKIGLSYIFLDKYKKAVDPLTKSIEMNSDNSSAYYNRGVVYYKLKKLEKSKQDLQKAVEINNFTNPVERKEAKDLLAHIEFLESAE